MTGNDTIATSRVRLGRGNEVAELRAEVAELRKRLDALERRANPLITLHTKLR